VEFNHAISYVNKIKVSGTATVFTLKCEMRPMRPVEWIHCCCFLLPCCFALRCCASVFLLLIFLTVDHH
jgi:hypothetical protein